MKEDVVELAGLYALDALEPDERSQFEAVEAASAEVRAEVDAYREVAAVLAQAVETVPSTPSPDVWRSIHAAVTGEAEEARRPKLATVTDIRDHRRWTRWAALVSAAAVLVSVALGVRVFNLQNQIDERTIDELAAQAVTAEGSRLVTLDGQEGFEASTATIVLGADGIGYLLSDNLTSLPAERTYQLWVIVDEAEDTRVISAGVLGSDPRVSQFSAVGNVTGFAITEEVAGGVPVSEGPTVAVGLLDA